MGFANNRARHIWASVGSVLIVGLVGFCQWDAILVRYHRFKVSRLESSASSSIEHGLQIVKLDELEFHRDRLVELGDLFHKRYVFDNLLNSREVRIHIAGSLKHSFPDNRYWMLSSSFTDVSEKPLVLEVCDKTNQESEWNMVVKLLKEGFANRQN